MRYLPYGVDRTLFQWILVVFKSEFIVSHCESHSVGFSILGSDVAYYAAVCDLATLGYLMLAKKATCVGALNILDYLEEASYLICKCSCPFWFFRPPH